MGKSIAIIGSGIAGIAASIRLANQGHSVTVFEANSYPGGKLTEFTLGQYRFDAGPSLFTLPELVVELFTLCGEDVKDHFDFKALEETCKYFYPDGTEVTAFSDREKLFQEFEEKLNEPRVHLKKALSKSEFLYNELSPLFMHRSLHKVGTWLGSSAFRAYTNLNKFDFNRSMNKANESLFENPKTVQLFNRYATYNGSDPYQTPATLNIIPHLEFGIGAFFPKKGMYAITESLFQLAKRQGVKFIFDTKVNEIVVHHSQAKGVNTHMGFHKVDRVISNMDVLGTYKKLLKEQKHPSKILKQPRSSSALIFYWGIKKEFKNLSLHNIFFSGDYKKEFDHIFRKNQLFDDPTVYVNITSTQRKEDAPEGCQNWFTMINLPNNNGQDWDRLIKEARKSILDKLSEQLGENIESLIEVEDVLDPRLIESRTSSIGGSLYGNSSNSKFAAFMRHANFSSDIKHLYFVGGSVHPGGGIPLCLLSAKVMSDNFD